MSSNWVKDCGYKTVKFNYYPGSRVIKLGRANYSGENPVVKADLSIDLSTAASASSKDVIMNFNHAAYGDYYYKPAEKTGIFLSDDGINFTKVSNNFVYAPTKHTSGIRLNITALATKYNLKLTDSFVIRTQNHVPANQIDGIEIWNVFVFLEERRNTVAKTTVLKPNVKENTSSGLFPNSNQGKFSIRLGDEFILDSNIVITIYNTSTKAVYKEIRNNVSIDNRTMQINASKLDQGLYIVTVVDNNGNSYKSKMIID